MEAVLSVLGCVIKVFLVLFLIRYTLGPLYFFILYKKAGIKAIKIIIPEQVSLSSEELKELKTKRAVSVCLAIVTMFSAYGFVYFATQGGEFYVVLTVTSLTLIVLSVAILLK